MGEAGPGPDGQHDPDCEIANLYALLSPKPDEGKHECPKCGRPEGHYDECGHIADAGGGYK